LLGVGVVGLDLALLGKVSIGQVLGRRVDLALRATDLLGDVPPDDGRGGGWSPNRRGGLFDGRRDGRGRGRSRLLWCSRSLDTA